MIRQSIGVGVFIAATAVAPQVARAQAPAERSQTRGVHAAVHVSATGSKEDGADESEDGGGLGVRLGWGFTKLFTLYLQLDGAAMQDADGGEFALAHLDLGGRFHFMQPTSRWRPYADVAVGARSTAQSVNRADYTLSGGAVSLGGGVQYYLTRNVALDVGLKFSGGEFTDAEVNGERIPVNDPPKVGTSRFTVGVSWWPRKG